jgi:hypothetical protein
MAAKVETLRITARPNTTRRAVVACFAAARAAAREWARHGQLGADRDLGDAALHGSSLTA